MSGLLLLLLLLFLLLLFSPLLPLLPLLSLLLLFLMLLLVCFPFVGFFAYVELLPQRCLNGRHLILYFRRLSIHALLSHNKRLLRSCIRCRL